MTEWVYKATTTKATFEDTRALALADHFLCRSAFEKGTGVDGLRQVARAWDVDIGDFIHFFYRVDKGDVGSLGTFRVVDGRKVAPHFCATTGPNALLSVDEVAAGDGFVQRLRRGYKHDRRMGAFVGWAIEPAPATIRTPAYDHASLFPAAQITLWKYPDPGLPK
jgi:hypothetical protein